MHRAHAGYMKKEDLRHTGYHTLDRAIEKENQLGEQFANISWQNEKLSVLRLLMLSFSEQIGDKVSRDQMSRDQVPRDQVSRDQVYGDQEFRDHVSRDQVSGTK